MIVARFCFALDCDGKMCRRAVGLCAYSQNRPDCEKSAVNLVDGIALNHFSQMTSCLNETNEKERGKFSFVHFLWEKFLMNGVMRWKEALKRKSLFIRWLWTTAAVELATRHWRNYTCKWFRFSHSFRDTFGGGNYGICDPQAIPLMNKVWNDSEIRERQQFIFPISGIDASPSRILCVIPKKHCSSFLVCEFVIIVCKSHLQGCFSVLILSSGVTET